jgi:hypothetical protein
VNEVEDELVGHEFNREIVAFKTSGAVGQRASGSSLLYIAHLLSEGSPQSHELPGEWDEKLQINVHAFPLRCRTGRMSRLVARDPEYGLYRAERRVMLVLIAEALREDFDQQRPPSPLPG